MSSVDTHGTDLRREQVDVDGVELSYLTAGRLDAPPLLLLHGTFWSRVWQPVVPQLAEDFWVVALDLPGFGLSEGEMDLEHATVPAMAQTVLRAADALGMGQLAVGAHDIGGAIAQHLVVHGGGRVRRMVLMNAVMLDSWPVPAVARFRDPQVRAEATVESTLEGRRRSMAAAVGRPLSEDEVEDYVQPWRSAARVRSWSAMAGAADPRYTLDLLPGLVEAAVPTRLVWGRDDEFQKIEYARRYVEQVPGADLVEVPGTHIPTEDSPREVASAMLEHLRG